MIFLIALYLLSYSYIHLFTVDANPVATTTAKPAVFDNETFFPTRRILRGRDVRDTRPYMVYLRAATAADPKLADSNWLCGGVIIHERYILTSAACIEDAKRFYVVSGTHHWIPIEDKTNECIHYGAKKAIWKCVPKAYYFDGEEFDNIRWMVGDIAVVKVEDNFHFEKRVRGCDFIPQKVDFNNKSTDFEKPKTVASIAGWGSTDLFSDGTLIGQPKLFRSAENSPQLLETDVVLISKKNCKKRWDPRYHYIIDEHMLCSKDEADAEAMAIACTDHEVNCKELQYSDDDKSDDGERRMMYNPNSLYVHTAGHKSGRRSKIFSGGFCENDHGGPLIHGQSKTSMVIGIMSACLTKDVDRKCFGPFLYTSVYRYRNLISCAIDKDIGPTCRKLLRSSKTITETFDWSNHVDGLPKSDHPAIHQVRSSLDHFKLMGTSDKKQSIQDPEKKGTPEPALGPDRDPVSPKPVF